MESLLGLRCRPVGPSSLAGNLRPVAFHRAEASCYHRAYTAYNALLTGWESASFSQSAFSRWLELLSCYSTLTSMDFGFASSVF
jgi:hypothetical protein